MNTPPNREVALFSAALELPVGQRPAYLEDACGDYPALRLRLEALLRVHQDAITFLENKASKPPESPVGHDVSDATMRIAVAPSEKAGDRIRMVASETSCPTGDSGGRARCLGRDHAYRCRAIRKGRRPYWPLQA